MNGHPTVTKDHAWSGSRYIHVLEPKAEDMDLDEIATGLSREQRYGGAATSIFWSVAQHSLLAVALAEADGVERPVLRALLMHDAPEFMLRDFIRPLKINVPGYAPVEAAWWAAIAARFDLPSVLPGLVKKYDNLALAVEKRWLIDPGCGDWPGNPDAGSREIPGYLLTADMQGAKRGFLAAAHALKIA